MGCRSCNQNLEESPSYIMTAEQVIMKDKKPQVEEDGSLLFDDIAPTMHGYVHDRSDPTRLKLDTVPCTERITLPVLGRDSIWVMNQCNHIGCPTRGETVDEEICRACPFRKELGKRDLLEG